MTVLGWTLIVAGAVLSMVAAIGLQRFDDVFARMHSATKPATLGLLLILGGAGLVAPTLGAMAKLALVILLQFLTAPLAAHLVGRAAYRAGTELSDETFVQEDADTFLNRTR